MSQSEMVTLYGPKLHHATETEASLFVNFFTSADCSAREAAAQPHHRCGPACRPAAEQKEMRKSRSTLSLPWLRVTQSKAFAGLAVEEVRERFLKFQSLPSFDR
jgi:hypothetical protein